MTGQSIGTSSAFTSTTYAATSMIVVDEYKQLQAVIQRLMEEREKETPQGAKEFMEDFYAFLSPVYDSVLQQCHVFLPRVVPQIFTSADLFFQLESIANRVLIDEPNATADEGEQEQNLESVFASVTTESQKLDEAMKGLLLSEQLTSIAHRVVAGSKTLTQAGVRVKMMEIRPILEQMLWSSGCSAGMSQQDFKDKVHRPIQSIMQACGAPLFKGAVNYMAKSHPEFQRIKKGCFEVHGGLSMGEGVHVPLKQLVQDAINSSGTRAAQQYLARGGKEKRLAVLLEVDAAWIGHSTNLLQMSGAGGKQQHTIASVAVAGDGCLSLHGRSLKNLFIYIGNDKHPFLTLHLGKHYKTIQDFNDGALRVTVKVMMPDGAIDIQTDWRVDIMMPVDMSAEFSIKQVPSSRQGVRSAHLGWTHLPDWVYKTQTNKGNFLTGLPITYHEEALRPLLDAMKEGERDVVLGEWGVKYNWGDFPLKTLKNVYQGRFHGCATLTKYVFQVIFRIGHTLGTAKNITGIILDTVGYLLSYNVVKLRGKDQVILKGGLTSGAYIDLLSAAFNEIGAALIPDDFSADSSVVDEWREQIVSILRDITKNNVFVLSPHPDEWESFLQSFRMYTATEDRWTSKFFIIAGPHRTTPTMRSRSWNLLYQIWRGVVIYKMNASEFVDEAKGEERHKLYHYIRKRVRAMGAEMSTEELKIIMAQMGMEDYMKFESAGGYDKYRETNARRHANKITKGMRRDKHGESFENRMYREEKEYFERVVARVGRETVLDPSNLDFIRCPSQEFDGSGMNIESDDETGDFGGGGGNGGNGGGGGGGGDGGGWRRWWRRWWCWW